MEYELPVDEYHAVGPHPDIYDHGPVTGIGDHLFVCLDCGYTTHDPRLLLHADCEREENPVNVTWRERIEEYPFPEVFEKRHGDLP